MTEVDQLIRNAELRDALEPYLDEAIYRVNTKRMPTATENEFLASMLAWERAPILPVSKWFSPELSLPAHESLDEFELHERLHEVIGRLFQRRIVLEFTEHLSDRELYCLIIRDILPSYEKQIDIDESFLHWQCIDPAIDEQVWLSYYASEEEREAFQAESETKIPDKKELPYPRDIPRR